MGSFFAGVKAGTIGGIIYLGGFALFNVLVLYASKDTTLTAFSQSLSQFCGGAAASGTFTGTPQECFDSVVTVLIPIIAFIGFFVALGLAGMFGKYYETFPGAHPLIRGEVIAAVTGGLLLLLGLTGVYFSQGDGLVLYVFFLAWTVVYGVIVGKLYRKYTRLVEIGSQDPATLRVMVDGKDYTGRSMTFALTSSHEVRAEASEGKSFKGWSASGGVRVEDARSFETTIEVEGDGVLRAQSTSAN